MRNKTQIEMNQRLRIRPETLQLQEENIGSTFHHLGAGTNFLNKTPKAQ